MTGDVTRQGIVAEDTQDSGSGGTAPDPTGSHGPAEESDRRISMPVIVSLVLGGLLVAGVGTLGLIGGRSTPAPVPALSVSPVAAPDAGSPSCAALRHALPATLSNGSAPLAARRIAAPAPAGVSAWGTSSPVVVLRCGVARPTSLTPTSELLVVDGVKWFQTGSSGATTWYAVDRRAVVALTVPVDAGTGPIQDVSVAVSSALPAVPVF